MRKIVYSIKSVNQVCLILGLMLLAQTSMFAQKKTFVREYTYQASESDSKITAREAATTQMRKMLLKEIGEFIYSETNMNTKAVTVSGKEEISQEFTDKVKAITAGFVEMNVLEEIWSGATYFIKAEMTVDQASVRQRIAEALNKNNLKLPTQMQETLLGDLEIMNLGDGKYFARTRQEQQPLNGDYRIIDGRNSEYVQTSFKEGLYEGKYQLFVDNRIKEEGSYSGGYKDGVFKEYYPDATNVKKEVPYKNGKINGMVRCFYLSGKIEKEKEYSNGVEQGIEKHYSSENGECVFDCFYQDGQLHGKDMRHISGTLQYVETKNYNKGILQGAYSCRYMNGKLYKQGAYVDGKKAGQWIQLFDNGDTVSVENYKNGLRNGLVVAYSNGKREMACYFANDKKEGVCINYNVNTGKKVLETIYKDDKKDGLEKRWYLSAGRNYVEISTFNQGRKSGPLKCVYLVENGTELIEGKIKQTGQYENGRRTGHWVSYNANGTIEEEWDEQ